ncbi:MAG: hypothetical protein K9J06_13565 [Flavobacteriales bacterium]|nr:hypothetical protein [Flavobacteriales bacterium]
MIKKLFPWMALLLMPAILFTGCDPTRGCTDPYSDNFNPDATEDDDTCVPTRLKFVGEYDCNGTSHTGDTVLTSYDQVQMSITDETANTPEDMIMGISNFDQPLYSLDLLVTSQYGFSITTQTIGAFTFFGSGNINGRVIEMSYTRIEKIEIEPEVFDFDTLYLSLYGIQNLD